MKNSRKYRTREDRLAAFRSVCDDGCSTCPLYDGSDTLHKEECILRWLDQDDSVIPSPDPCPYCGGECSVNGLVDEYWVSCTTQGCEYNGCNCGSRSKAIERHNRLVRAADGAAMEQQA